jgi:glycosyltransferase involved in cell wall biosynthesis
VLHVDDSALARSIQNIMIEPIRVTHIITGLATGGAETMLLKLLSGMNKDRFQNTVISLTDAGPIGDQIRALGVPLTVLGMNRSLPMPWDLFRLYRRIRQQHPHVVQTWLYHADLLGYITAKLAGVRKIVWNIRCSYMGEDYYKGMSGVVIRILAWISAKPDAVVVNSTSGKLLHESLGYAPANWNIIPNGFDVSVFKASADARRSIRREWGIADDVPVIGLVGRWDPVKGHDVFLQAATELITSVPDCQFVVVGKGCDTNNADLLKLVDSGLRLNLHLLGERYDIPDVTAAFDIAVCASIGEGFPNALGEAMACEVPCVATNVGDCAEIIADTGRIVAAGDTTAMARAWAELLSLSASDLADLGARARNRVSKIYGIQDIIVAYQVLYQDLRYS